MKEKDSQYSYDNKQLTTENDRIKNELINVRK